MTPERMTAATSTLALLAALGVAQAQSIEGVGVGASGESAATAVGATPESAVGVSHAEVRSFGGGLPNLLSVSLSQPSFWHRKRSGIVEAPLLSLSMLDTRDIIAASRNGDFACGRLSTSTISESSFRWKKDGTEQPIVGLAGLAADTYPVAISDDGGVVVGSSYNLRLQVEAFRWDATTETSIGLGDLAGGTFTSIATAISGDGAVIAGMSDSGSADLQWCRWVGGAIEPLGIFGEVHGISANGSVIVGRDASGEAIAWNAGVVLPLGVGGTALGASADGSAIVGTDRTGQRAWYWTPDDGAVPLESLLGAGPGAPTDLLAARDVSPDGGVIVGWMGDATSHERDDAADGPFGATPIDGPTRAISGTLGGADARDAFYIAIEHPDDFYATTSTAVDPAAGAAFDTRLWLFDLAGNVVLANDDRPGGAPDLSTISDPADFAALTGGAVNATAPASLAPGLYVLVIGQDPDGPLDGAGIPLADLESAFTELHGANPAAAAFDHWPPDPAAEVGSYTIALRGVQGNIAHLAEEGFVLSLAGPCPADLDGDGSVGFTDLLAILAAWGPCAPSCAGDLDDDGVIGFSDLLVVLSSWGDCP